MLHTIKKKTHSLMHPELGNSRADRIFNGFIIILIILNVTAVMLETVPSIHDGARLFFTWFDTISVIIFTVEYLLRVWSCTHDPQYKHPVFGRIKYMLSTGALIDLLAILPFYVHIVIGLDLRVLRILRLLRFLRLFRLTSYMHSARLVRNVFRSRANDLKLSLVIISFLIVIASCLVYFAEYHAQPQVFSSIPATIWWAVITVTSVGYGDMVPVTITGKMLTGLISLLGLAVYALPAGIITAGFLEEMNKRKKKGETVCPHCGKPLENNLAHS